jgi:hypothetical protein
MTCVYEHPLERVHFALWQRHLHKQGPEVQAYRVVTGLWVALWHVSGQWLHLLGGKEDG